MKKTDRSSFKEQKMSLPDGQYIKIRPLNVGDGRALSEFYSTVPEEDFRFYCPHPLDEQHATQNAEKADSPTEIVLVAEAHDNSICGYAWLRWEKTDSPCSTFGICISRSCQGHGLGRALMTCLFETARGIAPQIVHLTVQKANAKGLKLYISMGFKVIKEQVRPAGFQPGLKAEPEYLMEMQLK